MSDDKISLREEINKRVQETEKLIFSLKEQTKPVAPDRAIGRLTRMDAIQQKNMSEAHLETAEEKLLLLIETLAKLDEADFGICNRCKKAIPLERVMAIPETRLCVACASKP